MRTRTERMVNKAVWQGHSESRGEAVQTALRVSRPPIGWFLVNG